MTRRTVPPGRDEAPPAAGAAEPSVAVMVESIVGCKWSVRLLQLCAGGPVRPGAALRACPGLSAKVMNERWRKMRQFGLVERVVTGEKPPLEVEYRLTALGRRFLRILDEVRRLQEELDRGGLRAGPGRALGVPASGAAQPRPSSGRARQVVAGIAGSRARTPGGRAAVVRGGCEH